MLLFSSLALFLLPSLFFIIARNTQTFITISYSSIITNSLLDPNNKNLYFPITSNYIYKDLLNSLIPNKDMLMTIFYYNNNYLSFFLNTFMQVKGILYIKYTNNTPSIIIQVNNIYLQPGNLETNTYINYIIRITNLVITLTRFCTAYQYTNINSIQVLTLSMHVYYS